MRSSAVGDIAHIFAGLSPYGIERLGEDAGGVPLLNLRDIEHGVFDVALLERFAVASMRDSARYMVAPGDVALACRGTVMKVALIPAGTDPLLISANLLGIRVREQISGEFLAMYLASEAGQDALRQVATSSAWQLVLRVEDIAKLRVPVPAPAEQEKLVRVWTAAQEQYRSHLASAALCRSVGERVLAQTLKMTEE
jgi:hypothetical protein